MEAEQNIEETGGREGEGLEDAGSRAMKGWRFNLHPAAGLREGGRGREGEGGDG